VDCNQIKVAPLHRGFSFSFRCLSLKFAEVPLYSIMALAALDFHWSTQQRGNAIFRRGEWGQKRRGKWVGKGANY
jgi:hypothetical protein